MCPKPAELCRIRHNRYTMATMLLNADADLVTIQDLLGHDRIKTTQRYCKISNLKVQKDYFRAMDKVLQQISRIALHRIFRGCCHPQVS